MTTQLEQQNSILEENSNSKQLLAILLPKFFNDGKKVPSKLFNQTFNEFLDIFGGYSVVGNVNGAWRENGKVYKDVNVHINIMTDKFDEFTLSTLVNNLKERFKQLAIYTTIQEVKSISL